MISYDKENAGSVPAKRYIYFNKTNGHWFYCCKEEDVHLNIKITVIVIYIYIYIQLSIIFIASFIKLHIVQILQYKLSRNLYQICASLVCVTHSFLTILCWRRVNVVPFNVEGSKKWVCFAIQTRTCSSWLPYSKYFNPPTLLRHQLPNLITFLEFWIVPLIQSMGLDCSHSNFHA